MDGRFLVLGTLLLAGSAAGSYADGARSPWVWAAPFALVVLFLAAVGKGPGAMARDLQPVPNTDGRPSEVRARERGDAQSPER